MKVTIGKINGNTIEYVEDGKNDVTEANLADWVKPEFVSLGEATLTIVDDLVTFCKMATEPVKQENTQAQNSDNSIVKISGKDFMTYEGLLKKAHAKGEFSMVILESYVSEDMKRSWCKVRLTAKNDTFDGFGSSTPENTGTMTSSHPVEMAHTRAKGRALRDYLNIGLVMQEELK